MYLNIEVQSVESISTRAISHSTAHILLDVKLTTSQAIDLLHTLSEYLEISHFERMVKEMKEEAEK